jgi:hypothetical protein
VEVHAGVGFAVVRLADGGVRAWGVNDYGQLGTIGSPATREPGPVSPLARTTRLAAALRHALALDLDGRVFGWGDTSQGQLATKPSAQSGLAGPMLVPALPATVDLAAGSWHSLMLGADGSVWATGSGDASGLGVDTSEAGQIPGFSLAPNAWLLGDSDTDGLSNWQEYAAGTDALHWDTNGNGLSDLVDVQRGSPAANPDDDGDGVPNSLEQAQGTDPFNADSDGDGVGDLLDGYPLDPSRSERPAPTPGDTTPPAITVTQPATARPAGGGP